MSSKIKKALLAFSLAGLVGVSAAASACGNSKHPNARITIEFNGKTYAIDYILYRNMYPQTVQHFIELADAGFYNDTIIHDYRSSDWVGGAYSYNAEKEVTNNNGDVSREATDYATEYSRSDTAFAEYLADNCKEKAYYDLVTAGMESGKFTASVFEDMTFLNGKYAVSNPLPTVIGEFSANDHKIEDDKGLTASYGVLKTFYYQKTDVQRVYVKDSFGDIMPRDYNYNCATSLFSMQVKNSTSYSAEKYAVFGQLKNDSAKGMLEQLSDDISDYSTGLTTSKWSMTVGMTVDLYDEFAEESGRDIDVTFTVVSMPIIIRSIKITKY